MSFVSWTCSTEPLSFTLNGPTLLVTGRVDYEEVVIYWMNMSCSDAESVTEVEMRNINERKCIIVGVSFTHHTTLCWLYTTPHCVGSTPHHTVLALHHTTLCCRLYTTPHCVGSTPHHTVLQALHHTTLCCRLYTTPHCVAGSTPHHTVLQALHHTTLCWLYTTPHCVGSTPHHTVLQALHHTTLCCRLYTTPHCVAGSTPHHTVLALHHTTLYCRPYLVLCTGHLAPCSGIEQGQGIQHNSSRGIPQGS